jgi:hypothetical protein
MKQASYGLPRTSGSNSVTTYARHMSAKLVSKVTEDDNDKDDETQTSTS